MMTCRDFNPLAGFAGSISFAGNVTTAVRRLFRQAHPAATVRDESDTSHSDMLNCLPAGARGWLNVTQVVAGFFRGVD